MSVSQDMPLHKTKQSHICPYFTFDPNTKGKIIIRESEKDKLVAGESYTLNLKLTTKAGEHMYNNAVTFKVVSKPRDLFYIETEALPDLFENRY